MIDTHCHLVPGVDDGPADEPSAVALARAMTRQGVRVAVATPHLSSRYAVAHETIAAAHAALVAALGREGVPLDVRLAAEVTPSRAVSVADDELRRRSIGGHLLVECLPDTQPSVFELVADRIGEAGLLPVFAHPERSRAVQAEPALLDGLRRRGALLQLVAPSVVGQWGERCAEAAWTLLRTRRADMVASDAHGPRRPPLLAEAGALVRDHLGPDAWRALTETGPARLIGPAAP